jgi:hypothetical protein
MFSVKATPRPHNEHLRQLELELRESLESAVEDDGEEIVGSCSIELRESPELAVGSWQTMEEPRECS